MPVPDEFYPTVTFENVLVRNDGVNIVLNLSDDLLSVYNHTYTLQTNRTTQEKGEYFVYHDTFIGSTGLRIDNETDLTCGILEQFKTLHEMNMLSLPDNTRTYEFRTAATVREEVDLSVNDSGVNVGTGAGIFVVNGFSTTASDSVSSVL